MASSDDFRNQLRAGNITEALALALSKAMELKITTWVASEADELEADQAQPGHRLCTRINTIDGDIENEIGDLFLGYGPYRELRQFHLEQVAEGSTIIQNNLKSLQRLFEILVALRHSETVSSPLESESLDGESPPFTPAESVTDIGLVIPPPSSLEDPVFSPDAGIPDLTDAGLTIESQSITVVDSGVSPDNLIQDDVSQVPLSPLEEPSSSVTPLTDHQGELAADEEEEDDDWDNSVLDLLESLPVESPPPEALDSNLDEDWGDLVEEKPDPDLDALDLGENQDWGILTLDDLDEEPPAPSVEPNLNTSNPELDEDWGDLVEPEAEPSPHNPVPSMESLNLEEDEDWNEWVVEEPERLPNEPVTDQSFSDLDEDEDWGDLDFDEDSDPFTTAPSSNQSALDSEEDWDEFVAEELEPFSDILDEPPSSQLSSFLDNQDSAESVGETSDRADLRDNLETDASLENTALEGSESDVSADHTEGLHEENEGTHPHSSEKRVPPPPPPPSRFPPQSH